MNNRQMPVAIRILETETRNWKTPAVTRVSRKRDPFRVLVSCLLSLRTRDEVTGEASKRLFALADDPQKLLSLPLRKIERAIYPAAFFRNKSKTLHAICRELVERHGGKVPADLDALLRLKGVGRKTANLTLILGFDKMGICVDTHVHRISNRWGYVETKTPDATEMALREKLNPKYWKRFNDLLVTFGQNQCKPISPICSSCPLARYCQKVGVTKHR